MCYMHMRNYKNSLKRDTDNLNPKYSIYLILIARTFLDVPI